MATKKIEPVAAGAAADVLDRLATQYQGILEAAVTLRAVGSYDAAIAEREARIKSLDAEYAKTKGDFERLNARMKAAEQEAVAAQQAAATEAQAAVAVGRDKADRLIAAAGEQSTRILAEARTQAEQITRGAHEDARRHAATAAAAQVELEATKKQLEQVRAEISAATEQLSTAREKIRELLGAN